MLLQKLRTFRQRLNSVGDPRVVHCDICGARDYQIFYNFRVEGRRQYVAMCKVCGGVSLNPRLNEDQYFQYYQSEYYQNFMGRGAQESMDSDSELLTQEADQCQRATDLWSRVSGRIRKDASILEVGCGRGINLIHFQNRGCTRLFGIEPDVRSVELLRKKNVTIIADQLKTVPMTENEGQFDLILLSHVLEHFTSIPEALGVMRKLLKPNGELLIRVPDLLSEIEPLAAQFCLPHVNYFNATTLTHALKSAGFDVATCDRLPDTGELVSLARPSLKPMDFSARTKSEASLRQNRAEIERLIQSSSEIQSNLLDTRLQRGVDVLIRSCVGSSGHVRRGDV